MATNNNTTNGFQTKTARFNGKSFPVIQTLSVEPEMGFDTERQADERAWAIPGGLNGDTRQVQWFGYAYMGAKDSKGMFQEVSWWKGGPKNKGVITTEMLDVMGGLEATKRYLFAKGADGKAERLLFPVPGAKVEANLVAAYHTSILGPTEEMTIHIMDRNRPQAIVLKSYIITKEQTPDGLKDKKTPIVGWMRVIRNDKGVMSCQTIVQSNDNAGTGSIKNAQWIADNITSRVLDYAYQIALGVRYSVPVYAYQECRKTVVDGTSVARPLFWSLNSKTPVFEVTDQPVIEWHLVNKARKTAERLGMDIAALRADRANVVRENKVFQKHESQAKQGEARFGTAAPTTDQETGESAYILNVSDDNGKTWKQFAWSPERRMFVCKATGEIINAKGSFRMGQSAAKISKTYETYTPASLLRQIEGAHRPFAVRSNN